jgi:hypothetical protein
MTESAAKGSPTPPPRSLTVGRRYYGTSYATGQDVFVPFIRLSGKWLEEAGFAEGNQIAVIVGEGEIRLVCQKPKSPQLRQATLF